MSAAERAKQVPFRVPIWIFEFMLEMHRSYCRQKYGRWWPQGQRLVQWRGRMLLEKHRAEEGKRKKRNARIDRAEQKKLNGSTAD